MVKVVVKNNLERTGRRGVRASTIKVVCIKRRQEKKKKRRQEKKGVKLTSFAFVDGDVSDFFTIVNLILLKAGNYKVFVQPPAIQRTLPHIDSPVWSRFSLPWNVPINGPLAAHKEIKKQILFKRMHSLTKTIQESECSASAIF